MSCGFRYDSPRPTSIRNLKNLNFLKIFSKKNFFSILLGYFHYNGEGFEKDYFEAFEWYLKSAEQGFANAQYNIGQFEFFENFF